MHGRMCANLSCQARIHTEGDLVCYYCLVLWQCMNSVCLHQTSIYLHSTGKMFFKHNISLDARISGCMTRLPYFSLNESMEIKPI